MFLINNTNKLVRLRKESTIGKTETVKKCNFVNVKDLKPTGTTNFLKVRSPVDLKQTIIVPIDHRETVEDIR